MYTTLISVDQLQTLQASGQPFMVFDCSFELLQPAAGEAQYLQSHVAGAVRADLDRHLSAHAGDPAVCGGRHPLPTRESFAAWLGSVGFRPDMQAVVYDRQGVNYAGRLWWMLKWVGHEAVAVLDGGLPAWVAAQGALESGVCPQAVATCYMLTEAKIAWVATTEMLSQLGRPSQVVLDARATPRYLGEMEPIDPVAGHIPGALNRPFALNLGADGCFKSPAQLRSEFETLLAGRDPAAVVHHCGSGVSAVPNVIAMEVAGLGRSRLYAGSWSEWCSDPARPVAKG
jgi:thiosulfate/3-mercaptopyruvate sulfurtransferase